VRVVVSLDLAEVEAHADAGYDSLLLRAVEVFGKVDKARSWLNSPSRELGGKTPRDYAHTQDGRDRVLNILLDPEYGFPA